MNPFTCRPVAFQSLPRRSISIHYISAHRNGLLRANYTSVIFSAVTTRTPTRHNATASPASTQPVASKARTQPVASSNTSSPPLPFPDPEFNPPASTRPAPLTLPKREECKSKFAYYFRTGRAYLTFYKTGLKGLWANYKLANAIQKRVKKQRKQIEAYAKQAGVPPKYLPLWTRAEWQVLWRSLHDRKRLPIFVLMFVVFGEFLPLVMGVLKTRITPLLPYPVRLPSQVASERVKVMLRWRNVLKKWEGVDIQTLDVFQFARYSAEFHNLGPAVIPLEWIPKVLAPDLVLAFSRKYSEYLLYDDILLGKYGVRGLEDEEVVIATLERGIWHPDASKGQLRAKLQESVEKSLTVEPLS